jgi:dTDP-4-amino-4,6-dideoxygalactose transaminase
VRKTMLPFSPPAIDQLEIDEVVETLRDNWLTTGPRTQRFEREFAEYLGAASALAVNSGTAAMQVALATAGLGPGDEVITTTLTFCSTVHVIEQSGATPVLVDVDPETLNIDPAQVERAVTTRTRALLPVHLYGHPAEMDALTEIAGARKLFVLEDAAHALPARYRGRRIGSGDVVAAFSFYSTKNLTTGEGGMLTGGPELVESGRSWTLHGMTRDAYRAFGEKDAWQYDVVAPGFKCNMMDLQAAIGLSQLRKLDGFHRRRKEIAAAYNAAFSDVPEVQRPVERTHVESAWHLYPIRLHLDRLSIDRARFIEEMRLRNISTSVHFIPVHLHRYYREKYRFLPEDFPVAYRESQRLVSLPLNPLMTDQDAADVIEAVRDVVNRNRRQTSGSVR